MLVSLVTVPANMVIVPLAMTAVSGGFALLGVGIIWPDGARVIGDALDAIFYVLSKLSIDLAHWPMACFKYQLPVWGAWGCYVFIVVSAYFLSSIRRQRDKGVD